MTALSVPHDPIIATWHRASWNEFLEQTLPELLTDRLPLAGYQLDDEEPESPTRRVRVFLAGADGDVENSYDIPRPFEDGSFRHAERQIVCVAIAEAGVDLAEADVRCCGEQALEWVADRLRTAAPDERPADAAEARSWLPLDEWLLEFLQPGAMPSPQGTFPMRIQGPQYLQDNNWTDRYTHLRRLNIPDREEVMTNGHLGRVCVVETPEGPNVARVLSVARGAVISNRRVRIVDDSPIGKLGFNTACIPFLEHDDVNRALMGANMMRQWVPPTEREPAIVRTGLQPDDDSYWSGRNLLTAFISWDAGCYEDALVLSETASRKLANPEPMTIGDKLSHRHGAKGVVSQVVPDDAMPALPDGTPVELICGLTSLPSRLSMGSLREAVVSRMVRARGGESIDIAPFASPSEADLRRDLSAAGLADDGMEQLQLDGKPLERRSTVGWVYWGCTTHFAREKLHVSITPEPVRPTWLDGSGLNFGPQHQRELDATALRDAQAPETIREHFNTRAVGRADDESLAERVAGGIPEQAPPPSPMCQRLQADLAAAGIQLELSDGLAFTLTDPSDGLELAEPMPHPWLPEHNLRRVGTHDSELFRSLSEANRRLQRALDSNAPPALLERSRQQVATRLAEYLDDLIDVESVQFRGQVLFSARAVLAPALELSADEVGVPDKIARRLFAPLAARQMGGTIEDVAKGGDRALAAVDAAMADNWIIVHRAPALLPSNFIAFRPRRIDGDAIRLHPLATRWMNADFDGDQAALYLPVTEAGQREAEQQLTLAAHLIRDRSVLRDAGGQLVGGWLTQDAMWGLAHLARTDAGRQQINDEAGVDVCGDCTVLTHRRISRTLGDSTDDGQALVEAHARLQRLGFSAARRAGASLGIFAHASLPSSPKPADGDADALDAYSAEVQASLDAFDAFDDDALGAVRLAQESGARANLQQLSILTGAHVSRARSPWSQCEGQTPDTFFRFSRPAWQGLRQVHEQVSWHVPFNLRVHPPQPAGGSPQGGVLSRARMSLRPGIVFARAALRQEADPLSDPLSRLWVGCPAQ